MAHYATDYAGMLRTWKVTRCTKTCAHSAYKCAGHHGEDDQRRNPLAGTYSKDECITQREYQYHPTVYKTALCAQYSEFGHCRFGPHCAYRHIYQGRDDDAAYTYSKRFPWAPAPHELQLSFEAYTRLLTIKTQLCTVPHCTQHHGLDCLGYHVLPGASDAEDYRQPITRHTHLQPHPPYHWKPPHLVCRTAVECALHPLNFRTRMCKYGASCGNPGRCTHAHSQAEMVTMERHAHRLRRELLEAPAPSRMVVELRYEGVSETLYVDAERALQDLQACLEMHGVVPTDGTTHSGSHTASCWARQLSARATFTLETQQQALLLAIQLLQAYLPGELTKRENEWQLSSGIVLRVRFAV